MHKEHVELVPAGAEEYNMPSAEALVASTLALMTGFAQACCEQHRELMKNKIASNLLALAEHPHLCGDFKCMLWRLREHWQAPRNAAMPSSQVDQSLWHASSTTVQ